MNSSKLDQLSEEQIKKAPEENYMNEEQLAFFKNKLLELYESTVTRIQEVKDQMANPLDFSDANDRASWEEQSSIALRIVEREQKLLPKIRQSLERIRSGDYGYCLESGEPIGIPRLLARPTAEYCADVKAVSELKENHYKS
ncbi:MAG: TraR/DksA C4-type zinc finger protein [Cellvibrionaceae bacterium]